MFSNVNRKPYDKLLAALVSGDSEDSGSVYRCARGHAVTQQVQQRAIGLQVRVVWKMSSPVPRVLGSYKCLAMICESGVKTRSQLHAVPMHSRRQSSEPPPFFYVVAENELLRPLTTTVVYAAE